MMMSKSIWNAFSETTHFPQLSESIKIDVAIIGGGITGITTAELLKKKGLSVCVLEARKVGGGSTSDSTGNLYTTIDHGFHAIESKYGKKDIQEIFESRKKALDQIENNVKNFKIDCDFKRVPMFLYSANDENSERISDEFETVMKSGINILIAQEKEIPLAFTKAFRLPNQAQFNPMRYVQNLAKAIESENCQIFENTRVTEIKEKDDRVFLQTTSGNIQANNVVYATHTPKGVRLMYHTVLGPYREYGVAARLNRGNFPNGIFWGYFDNGSKYSLRSYKRNDEHFLIAVGQPHKVGQGEDNAQNIQNLVSFLLQHFDVGEITYRWGGQHYRPADKLPYIGRKTKNSRIYLATGFSTDGLVYGTLSAQLISDEIAGIENSYAKLYKASRLTPVKSAKEFAKENLNAAAKVLKDLVSKDDIDIKRLEIGEGEIVSKDGHKIAVQKTETAKLRTFSAFCPHLGCILHWNHVEKTWDCPCHGSRFDQEGCVLEGPALHPMKKIIFEDGNIDSRKRK